MKVLSLSTFCAQSLKLKVPDTLSIELPCLVHATHSDSKAPRTKRLRDSVHHMSYHSELALAFSVWTAENGATIALLVLVPPPLTGMIVLSGSSVLFIVLLKIEFY